MAKTLWIDDEKMKKKKSLPPHTQNRNWRIFLWFHYKTFCSFLLVLVTLLNECMYEWNFRIFLSQHQENGNKILCNCILLQYNICHHFSYEQERMSIHNIIIEPEYYYYRTGGDQITLYPIILDHWKFAERLKLIQPRATLLTGR